MSCRKARTQHLRLNMQYIPQSCRKGKKTMSIHHTAIISINYTTEVLLFLQPYVAFFPPCRNSPIGPWSPQYQGFTITLRHTTVGMTPLDEWSARRRDLYLTIHNTHNGHISMPSGGIRTHSPSKRAAIDPSLRPCGHWDLHSRQ
jgi:hypothetical protein